MKKLTALFIIITMILSLGVSALANDEMENALALVKTRIGSTDMYDKFNSYSRDFNGQKEYVFTWSTSDSDIFRNLSVTVIPSGIITNYDSITEGSSSTEEKHTTDEALAVAEKFIAQINPDIAQNIKVSKRSDVEAIEQSFFSFDLQRYENNIPVSGDTGSITVAADLSKVTDFHLNSYTENVPFDTTENIIDEEAAKNAFFEKIGMELFYAKKYVKGKEIIYPAYQVAKENTYINPYSGEPFSPKEYSHLFYKYANSATTDSALKAEGSLSDVSFTDAELAELEKVAGVMKVKDVEKSLRKNKLFAIPEDFSLGEIYLRQTEDNDVIMHRYSMVFANSDRNQHIWFSLNAETGEIYGFSRYLDEKGEKKIAPEKAKETALSIAETLAPTHFSADKESDYHLKETNNDYVYTFIRHVNGIPYYNDFINVIINPYSGMLEEYNFQFSYADFPSLENCITPEEAYQKLIASHGFNLFYLPEMLNEKSLSADKMTLIYSPDLSRLRIINAETGKLLGEETQLSAYSDISGHYAEDAIKALKTYGIGYSGGLFEPGKEITRKEFATLALNVIKWNSAVIIDESNLTATQAADYGLLTKGDDFAAPISRIEAAEAIINALGIKEYASLPIYIMPFTDVPAEKSGITALLYGMGVIKGNGSGCFNPHSTLTRGDAAIMMNNYINFK